MRVNLFPRKVSEKFQQIFTTEKQVVTLI